ncbi:Dabb family protein [Kamptonema cortianum]|nr:Dabb family protein [Oscillatoria laete-virens]MDK3161858.1 Dabb family protein [Kamptonema cortianum]MDL5054428.1 Dabb family protein [Oscillatoria laete-virens NRMC-F 0139]
MKKHLFLIISFLLMGMALPAPCQAEESLAVAHVVVVWLKEPGNQEQIDKIIATSRGFHKIPGVTSVKAGRAISSERPVVDSSYDVAIIITFANERAMREYDTHPLHKKAVEEVIKPLVEKFIVYDFFEE